MADFKISIGPVLRHEGGYANDPSDSGGETYAGISRVHNPAWPGWVAIDDAKPLKQYAKVPAADPFVEVYYYRHYWPVIQGDKIYDQRLAGFLFDWYVNSGAWAIKAIQEITGLQVDGVIGPKTLAAINAGDAGNLFDQLKKSRIAFVKNVVGRKPSQKKYLAGWLKRIGSFK